MQVRSPLRQLELDTAVAAEGFLGLIGIDGLEFAEARGHQPLRRDALADEILHDRDRAPDGKLPVVLELRAVDRAYVGVAVDRQHPWDLARYLLFELEQRGGEPVELGASLGLVERGLTGIEEHLRLEHEAVADHADVGPVAENGAQPSEEVGTVALQLLHALRQRHIQPLAQIGDVFLRFLVLLLAGVERRFERGELAPQRRDLLIEHLDLRQRPRGEPLLRIELSAELGSLALRVGRAAADAFVQALVAVALALARRQARSLRVALLLEAELAGLLQREQLRELRDLRIEAVERGVFTGHFLRQVELHHGEHGEQEDDAQDERRQRIDESGPVVHAAVAARTCESHGIRPGAISSRPRARESPADGEPRDAAGPGNRPSRGSSAARCACGGPAPESLRPDWPWRRSPRGSSRRPSSPPAGARWRPANRRSARRRPSAVRRSDRARQRDRARWWRAYPRARYRSGSAPDWSASRGSRAPASRPVRTARTRTRFPCR